MAAITSGMVPKIVDILVSLFFRFMLNIHSPVRAPVYIIDKVLDINYIPCTLYRNKVPYILRLYMRLFYVQCFDDTINNIFNLEEAHVLYSV